MDFLIIKSETRLGGDQEYHDQDKLHYGPTPGKVVTHIYNKNTFTLLVILFIFHPLPILFYFVPQSDYSPGTLTE